MKPIHGIPVKSLSCPGAESFMPCVGYQVEKCQRVFIYFVFIAFHLFSGEHHRSSVAGFIGDPVQRLVIILVVLVFFR
jgi:hypothetical protein